MARQLTKAQILANYEATLVRCQALEAELASLRAASQPRIAAPRTARVLPSHFAAARELAMRTGCCVKVVA